MLSLLSLIRGNRRFAELSAMAVERRIRVGCTCSRRNGWDVPYCLLCLTFLSSSAAPGPYFRPKRWRRTGPGSSAIETCSMGMLRWCVLIARFVKIPDLHCAWRFAGMMGFWRAYGCVGVSKSLVRVGVKDVAKGVDCVVVCFLSSCFTSTELWTVWFDM